MTACTKLLDVLARPAEPDPDRRAQLVADAEAIGRERGRLGMVSELGSMAMLGWRGRPRATRPRSEVLRHGLALGVLVGLMALAIVAATGWSVASDAAFVAPFVLLALAPVDARFAVAAAAVFGVRFLASDGVSLRQLVIDVARGEVAADHVVRLAVMAVGLVLAAIVAHRQVRHATRL